jgi:hypothetical protein
MSYFPIDVEGLVRRSTLGARATDPRVQPRRPRRRWRPQLSVLGQIPLPRRRRLDFNAGE